MSLRAHQVCGILLGVSAALVGMWAGFFPASFYRDFPLPGHHWVSALGPANEHLIRDVGTLYLSLLVLTVWSVVRPTRERFAITGIAWLVFSIPHLVFHLRHLQHFPMIDVIGQVVTLGGTCVLAGLLCVGAPTRRS